MALRWRRSSPLQRRVVGPVFVAASALGITHISFHVARQIGASPQAVVDPSWIWALCVVAVCAAVLFGVLWRPRCYRARCFGSAWRSVRVTAARTSAPRSPRPCPIRPRVAVPRALDRDVARRGGRQHIVAATARTEPDGDAAVRRARQAQIVLIHDVALRDDPELLAGIGGIVLAGRRHEQLTADRAAASHELDESGRRVSEAADVERERIQRDLHDGAQQRLVALRIRLALAEERLGRDPIGGMADLRDLGTEVEVALDELRSIGRGAFPTPLVDRGLVAAVQSLAAQVPTARPCRRQGRPAATGRARERGLFLHAPSAPERHQARGRRDLRPRHAGTDRRRPSPRGRDDGAGFTPGSGQRPWAAQHA